MINFEKNERILGALFPAATVCSDCLRISAFDNGLLFQTRRSS
jgi:hypothetical protein